MPSAILGRCAGSPRPGGGPPVPPRRCPHPPGMPPRRGARRVRPLGEVGLQRRPEKPAAAEGIAIAGPAVDAAPPRPPSLIPARPPIRLEDGLVEVGWEGDLEAELTRPEPPPIEAEAGPRLEAESGEQLVEDRYAALQAWAEWSRNRERSATSAIEPSAAADTFASDAIARHPGTDPGPNPPGGPPADAGSAPTPSLRAETPHDFAPYSQLFTRLRHSL